MNKKLLLALLVLIGYSSYAQITYEPGYFIDNNGQKHEVLIKNTDWRQNPVSFEYKTSETAASETASIANVREFGVDGFSTYQRFTVDIDQSSENKNSLSRQRAAQLAEKTVFLKLLLAGEANLYQYVGDANRFFYSLDEGPVTQLIYKQFQSGNQVRTNNRFRQQLLNNVACGNLEQKDVQRIDYNKSSLTKFFERYNECKGSGSVSMEAEGNKGDFKLKILAGVTKGSLDLERVGSVHTVGKSVSMDTDISPRIGLEAEYLLPFNKQKWSVFAAPAYLQVSGEGDFHYKEYMPDAVTTLQVDYKALAVPVGVKYHFYLNNDSKFFVDAAYNLSFFFNGTIDDSENAYEGEMEVASAAQTLELGLGYEFKKFGAQFKYTLPKDNFSDHPSELGSSLGRWEGVYSSISVLLTYTIF
ncbi:MAG: hypothetical protein WBL27_09585 [Salinimicrobium sp.]